VDQVICGKVPTGDDQCRFDYHVLEAAIKTIINERLGDEDHPLSAIQPSPYRQCATFVVACSALNASATPTVFRSYNGENVRVSKCLIWQAARATTAAPLYFKEIEFGNPPIPYVDGGFGHNNPSEIGLSEAKELWPAITQFCLVSLGTGRSTAIEIGNISESHGDIEKQRSFFQQLMSSLPDLGKWIPGWKTVKAFPPGVITLLSMARALASLVTNSEEVNRRLSKNSAELVYFRFNVDRDVGDIGLEDWKMQKHITAHTAAYLGEPETEQKRLSCVKYLIETKCK